MIAPFFAVVAIPAALGALAEDRRHHPPPTPAQQC
jgi:hypothetical protein